MSWMGLALVAVAAYLIYADYPLSARLLAIAAAATVLVMGLVKDLPKPEKWRRWSQRHVLLIGVIALFLMLNIVTRVYETVWDFSKSRIYSLRQESVEWIAKIPSKVEIGIFLRSDDKTSKYVNWLRKSSAALGDGLTIRVHNINRDVALVSQYDIGKAGEAVISAGERWVKIPGFTESEIVQGLVRLFSRQGTSICFVAGHGEPDILSSLPDGLSDLATGLRGIGYGTRTISLATADPEELETGCALLAIIGPRSEYFPNELVTLRKVLPKIPLLMTLGGETPPGVVAVVSDLGVSVGKHVLTNPDNVARQVPVTDITVDAVSQSLSGLLYFPQVRALTLAGTPAGWQPAVSTSPTQNIVEEGESVTGPFILVAARSAEGEPRRIVAGSSRLLINSSWRFGKNAEMVLLWTRWLMADDLLSLPSAALVNEPLMDLSDRELQWIKNLVFYGIPGMALAICFLVWWRHRR